MGRGCQTQQSDGSGGVGEVLLLGAVFLLGKPPATGRIDPQMQEWSIWLPMTLTPAIPGAVLP